MTRIEGVRCTLGLLSQDRPLFRKEATLSFLAIFPKLSPDLPSRLDHTFFPHDPTQVPDLKQTVQTTHPHTYTKTCRSRLTSRNLPTLTTRFKLLPRPHRCYCEVSNLTRPQQSAQLSPAWGRGVGSFPTSLPGTELLTRKPPGVKQEESFPFTTPESGLQRPSESVLPKDSTAPIRTPPPSKDLAQPILDESSHE